jgi:hypothetical protein
MAMPDKAERGVAAQDTARLGRVKARQARRGEARRGLARLGAAGQGRHGSARQVRDGHSMAW